MRKMKMSELEKLDVINLCTGERLGYICDIELSVDMGNIISFTVSSGNDIFFFQKKEEYTIPWKKIECVGEDTVLVKIQSSELEGYLCGKCKRCK